MELKDIIVDRMNQLGINNEELAKRMGVAPSTTLRYIKGDITNIRRDKIKKLADALSIDVSYLMGWKEYDPNEKNDISPINSVAFWTGKLLKENNEYVFSIMKKISELDENDLIFLDSVLDSLLSKKKKD